MKRNPDLRSLRIDLADAGLGSGKMPDLRGFWDAQRFGLAIHIALRPDKSGFKTGARGLDGLPSIDISLRWSEDPCYTVEALFAYQRHPLNPPNPRFRQVSSHVFPFSRLCVFASLR